MYDIYEVFGTELCPQREEWIVHQILSVLLNREVCQQFYPELYLCLYSTGSSFELRYGRIQ